MNSYNILAIVIVIIAIAVLGTSRGKYNQRALWTSIVLLVCVSLMGTFQPVMEHFDSSNNLLQPNNDCILMAGEYVGNPVRCQAVAIINDGRRVYLYQWSNPGLPDSHPEKTVVRMSQFALGGTGTLSTNTEASKYYVGKLTDFKGQATWDNGISLPTSGQYLIKGSGAQCNIPTNELSSLLPITPVVQPQPPPLATSPAVTQQVALQPPQPSQNPAAAVNATVNASDVKCRRILEQAPNPPFVKITGKAANTIENVQFIDNNSNMVESGMGTTGTEFNFQCPQGTDIVGYDMNPQGNERPDTSLFGGIGPVYCQDGTVVGKGVGKVKTTRMGQAPQTMLTKFNFVDSKTMPIDKTVMGYMNNTNLENCASVCDMLKDNCGGFTYDNANKKCGLLYSVDSNLLQALSNGRTYQKS